MYWGQDIQVLRKKLSNDTSIYTISSGTIDIIYEVRFVHPITGAENEFVFEKSTIDAEDSSAYESITQKSRVICNFPVPNTLLHESIALTNAVESHNYTTGAFDSVPNIDFWDFIREARVSVNSSGTSGFDSSEYLHSFHIYDIKNLGGGAITLDVSPFGSNLNGCGGVVDPNNLISGVVANDSIYDEELKKIIRNAFCNQLSATEGVHYNFGETIQGAEIKGVNAYFSGPLIQGVRISFQLRHQPLAASYYCFHPTNSSERRVFMYDTNFAFPVQTSVGTTGGPYPWAWGGGTFHSCNAYQGLFEPLNGYVFYNIIDTDAPNFSFDFFVRKDPPWVDFPAVPQGTPVVTKTTRIVTIDTTGINPVDSIRWEYDSFNGGTFFGIHFFNDSIQTQLPVNKNYKFTIYSGASTIQESFFIDP